MAYSPPSKSTYGDELTEDTWVGASSPPASPTNYNQRTLDLSATQRTQNRANFDQESQQNLGAQDPKTLLSQISQEDMLFLRSFQQDSFVRRVLPLTFAGWGALYMYNKTKQLPNTFGRYFFIGIGAYIIGKFSYREEFKRRLMENRSNTPFMQMLRKGSGLDPAVGGYGSDASLDYNNSVMNDSSNWDNPGFSGQPSSFGHEARLDQPFQSSFETESTEVESAKHTTSYEELRARNRGFIK